MKYRILHIYHFSFNKISTLNNISNKIKKIQKICVYVRLNYEIFSPTNLVTSIIRSVQVKIENSINNK